MSVRIRYTNSIIILALLFVVISTVVNSLGAGSETYTMTAVWIIAVTAFVLFRLGKAVYAPCVRNVIICGYFTRLAVVFLEIFTGVNLETLYNDGDSFAFQTQAMALYNNNTITPSVKYPYYLNALYHIFGNNNYLVQLINIALTTMAILIIYNIMSQMGVKKGLSLITVVILSFAPFFMLYTTLTLREAIYIYLLARSVSFLIRWIYEGSLKYFIMSCICVGVCSILHDGFLVIAAVYLLVFLFDKREKNRGGILSKVIIITLSIVVCLSFVDGYGRIGYLRIDSLDSMYNGIWDALIMHVKAGGSIYLQSMQKTGIVRMILLYSPIRMLYFFLSPMMWDCRSVRDWAALLLDSSVHFIFFFQSITILLCHRSCCFRRTERYYFYDKVIIVLCLVVYSMGLAFSWGTTTAGTAIRHRSSLLCIEVALSAMIYHRKRQFIS